MVFGLPSDFFSVCYPIFGFFANKCCLRVLIFGVHFFKIMIAKLNNMTLVLMGSTMKGLPAARKSSEDSGEEP